MKHFNKIIIYLTLSDIFTWGLMVIISSITGLYLAQKLQLDDAVKIVGIGTGIFSLSKGLVQIPIGMVIDKIKSEKDDIAVLLAGNILMGIPFLLYPTLQSENPYYLLQCILGLGSAMNLVTWRKLFAKNVSKDHEGIQYGAYDTVMSISIALFSIIAGIIANEGGVLFDAVIALIGILMISSGIWAILIYKSKYSGSNQSI